MIAFAGSLLTSCAPDIPKDWDPINSETERVDIAIAGAISSSIHTELDNGLVEFYPSLLPLFNPNEHTVKIALDDVYSLELILFNYGLADPIDLGSFSAYPFQMMEDKNAYVIANYIGPAGKVLFTTTMDGLPPLIQVNVLEIRQIYQNGFNARIRDLVLYEDTEGSGDPTTIEIDGTFISKDE